MVVVLVLVVDDISTCISTGSSTCISTGIIAGISTNNKQMTVQLNSIAAIALIRLTSKGLVMVAFHG